MNKLLTALSSNTIRGNNKVLLFIVSTIFLFLLTIILFSRTVISYNTAKEIQSENETRIETIENWKKSVAFIEKEDYRPINKEQINSVTSDIMVAIQVYNLTLKDFKALQQTGTNDQQDPYQAFTMTVSGQYADLMKFLLNFKAKDALISLMSIDMSTSENKVSANLNFRIYIK